MKRNLFPLYLTALVFIGMAFICGCGASPQGTAIPAFDFIASREPALFSADVTFDADLVIIFTNPITYPASSVLTDLASWCSSFGCHTAGIPSTFEVTWSPDMREARISIEGWGNNMGRVQIMNYYPLIDDHGNVLPPFSRIWEYDLEGAPTSYSISGSISGGPANCLVYVFASTQESFQDPLLFMAASAGYGNPYNYSLTGMPPGNYYIAAFRDVNGHGITFEPGNYWGTYEGGSIHVGPNITGRNFTINGIPYPFNWFFVSGEVTSEAQYATYEVFVGLWPTAYGSVTGEPLDWYGIGTGETISYLLYYGTTEASMDFYVAGVRFVVSPPGTSEVQSGDLWGQYRDTGSLEAVHALPYATVEGINFTINSTFEP